ncbi:MAG: hypothetical protein IH796_08465, partial [Deltaproteobacteria bacterium]|nr:hypothetical protein [Deltaproteobacteria bacterium]
ERRHVLHGGDAPAAALLQPPACLGQSARAGTLRDALQGIGQSARKNVNTAAPFNNGKPDFHFHLIFDSVGVGRDKSV